MTDADRNMKIFAESVKTMVEKEDIDKWDSGPVPDYMDAYLSSKAVKDYLQERIENPDPAIVKYLKENNLEGLLFSRSELVLLHSLVQNLEDTKEYLNKKYGFSTILN